MFSVHSPLSQIPRRPRMSPASQKQFISSAHKRARGVARPSLVPRPADFEDDVDENVDHGTPYQVRKNKRGLMALVSTPKPKATSSAAVQTDVTQAPGDAETAAAVASSLPMEHARQFRGMRMRLHRMEMDAQKAAGAAEDVKAALVARVAALEAEQATAASAAQEQAAAAAAATTLASHVQDKLQTRLARMTKAAKRFARKNKAATRRCTALEEMLAETVRLEEEREEIHALENSIVSERFTEWIPVYFVGAFFALFFALVVKSMETVTWV